MKSIKYIATALLFGLTLAACDNKTEIDPVLTPTAVQEATLTDGANIDILLYKTARIAFNHPVELVNADGITLNGKPVSNAKVNICELTFDLALEPDTDYTLSIAAGALRRYGVEETLAPYSISFSTQPLPVVDKELINPNATAEAKKLYALLLETYGKKTFSGTMGDIAWGTGYYDVVTEAAGKAPAVIGFDFLHLASSPANWIDYGDITPIKQAWDNGAIPQIMWHWNVPRTNKRGAKLDAAVSKFSPANAITPGTWENEVWEADVKKVAGYLKLIQDAGIPVIFRPFHEAAGDYGFGPWFWWGAEGVDVTKQLWDRLYDDLVNKYGINNLIWEWTVQTLESGALAPIETMRNAYVGDTKCDFVGVDLYKDDDLWSDFDTFYAVRSMVEGHKMIALSENGRLFDPAVCFDKGETWLYFMQWYVNKGGEFVLEDYSPAYTWKSVMESPFVIDRAQAATLLNSKVK